MAKVTQSIVGIVFYCNDSLKEEIDLFTKSHGCKLWSTENIDEVSFNIVYQVEIYTTSPSLLIFLRLKYTNYFNRFISLSNTNKEASL